ncbi:hypothetical protein QUW56_02690 [Phocaeicola barnesiae]|uniref:hypothetical protein n=1 Tax=Phocaeicola barnesiae TaxID=376804 RepID=UPI0025A334DA|nr:hypothetical protein [Phocaeicola barnesiae]MDM8232306.1 hypothetical protein [Phocaeicola barnesiae]
MKECIECGRNLPESKFRAYETKSGTHYTSRCRLCESRHTAERQKLIRRAGKLAPYTNEQLVAELRRRGAYIMYGSDFDSITTI